MQVQSFNTWIQEAVAVKPYTKKLAELNPQRKYLGDTYNTDLFLRFKHLSSIRDKHGKRIGIERWFELAQLEDKGFYAAVLADQMGQPDVRELWRDLMGRHASKVKGQVIFKDPFKQRESQDDEVRDLVSESALAEPLIKESELDPEWKVIITYPEDSLYQACSDYFERLGIAFADISQKKIYVDGAEVSEDYFTENHLLAIEAHEIGHSIAGHKGAPYYSEKQEMEADWLGINLLLKLGFEKAATILADRFELTYKNPYDSLPNGKELEPLLAEYLEK
jgi:hypothetical protein